MALYPKGVPNPEKLGFIQINAIGHGGDFTQAIEALCQALHKKSQWTDAKGYNFEITAASIDDAQPRYAWVECKSKQLRNKVDVSFRFSVAIENHMVVEWEIETYNPFFGCEVELIHWMKNHIALIYHEKHDTFLCSFAIPSFDHQKSVLKRPLARHAIADEWQIQDETVIYRSETVDQVERRALPDLSLLEPWSADYARSLGSLPPNYDEMNEIARKYRKTD